MARMPFWIAFAVTWDAETLCPTARSSARCRNAPAARWLKTSATENAVNATIAANVRPSHQRMLIRTRGINVGEPRVPQRAGSFFAACGGSLLLCGESAVSPPRAGGLRFGQPKPVTTSRVRGTKQG